MRTSVRFLLVVAFVPAAIALYAACSSDDDEGTAAPATTPSAEAGAGYRGFEPAGQACTAPAQCYIDPKAADGGAEAGTQLAVKGTIYCETKVPNGYCTHECVDDSACCAVPGECRTSVKQVCSPFTNTENPKYCFLSCEDEDIRAAVTANLDAGGWDGGASDAGGAYDPNAYCYYFASVHSTCRSSGGGKQNRKICVPSQ